jgi:hypothetical protein
VGQERLGPSYFFISLVLGPLNSLLWYVPSSRYIWRNFGKQNQGALLGLFWRLALKRDLIRHPASVSENSPGIKLSAHDCNRYCSNKHTLNRDCHPVLKLIPTSPIRARLVISRSTCPPLSSAPHANNFTIRYCSDNTHCHWNAAAIATQPIVLNIEGCGTVAAPVYAPSRALLLLPLLLSHNLPLPRVH